jgi:hypothetical protein
MTGQYDMNSRPETWPGPDAVDEILKQEDWEKTDDYEDAAINWGINDADIVADIKDRFAVTDDYQTAFANWCDRQTP